MEGTLGVHLNRPLPETADGHADNTKCSIETQFVQLTTDGNGNSVEIPITAWAENAEYFVHTGSVSGNEQYDWR